ncbi:Maf-like protein [Croceivirga lutea]|uniref:Maf family nucleotide pyrophosphatase n=1 Tax=Croceivirga lutea TaxID=1775167 RepID=UPI00163AF7B3|nr:Maf family nucleotide pyrophosphatase [Croceivirga lutea]GGG43494.1 Maf-like protein [Croceivirga lutea]
MTKNPLAKHLEGKKVILASGSPRRKKFFEDFGVDFEIRLKSVEEVYPENLKAAQISDFLAELKASVFEGTLKKNEILITSDTVVWHNGESLAKASNEQEAIKMLHKLSGQWHQVITSVCFTTTTKRQTVNALTKVKFKVLTTQEINFYIEKYKPFDKAGAYGIQEWIGAIGIEEINGAYNTVVGLPTHLVYKTLLEL